MSSVHWQPPGESFTAGVAHWSQSSSHAAQRCRATRTTVRSRRVRRTFSDVGRCEASPCQRHAWCARLGRLAPRSVEIDDALTGGREVSAEVAVCWGIRSRDLRQVGCARERGRHDRRARVPRDRMVGQQGQRDCAFSLRVSAAMIESHFGRSIRTMSELCRIRSNTISFPSGVMSNVFILPRSLRRVSGRILFVAKSSSQKSRG